MGPTARQRGRPDLGTGSTRCRKSGLPDDSFPPGKTELSLNPQQRLRNAAGRPPCLFKKTQKVYKVFSSERSRPEELCCKLQGHVGWDPSKNHSYQIWQSPVGPEPKTAFVPQHLGSLEADLVDSLHSLDPCCLLQDLVERTVVQTYLRPLTAKGACGRRFLYPKHFLPRLYGETARQHHPLERLLLMQTDKLLQSPMSLRR
jgi:hypothetical protein